MKQIIKLLIMLIVIFFYGGVTINTFGQNVVRYGNIFIAKSAIVSKESKKTQYIYKDSKGNSYAIYLSPKGKAYYIKKDKDGKDRKVYVPEIGKQINPSAYKDDKSHNINN